MTASRPRRAKPVRTVRQVRPPDDRGVSVICVTVNDQATFYTVREIACEIGGRGFAVHRTGLGTLYHVRIGTVEDSSCECMGFLRYGYCRHVLGLIALAQAGLL